MGTRPPSMLIFSLIDYDRGFKMRLDGQTLIRLILACNWLNPSWRAGWHDASKALKINPELATSNRRKRKK